MIVAYKNRIIEFCQLVEFINEKNTYLNKERENFYSGGYSFEECYNLDMQELDRACSELNDLLKIIR